MDLRDGGSSNDPLFDRPLVRGIITPEGGIVEMRRPGSDEVERHEIRMVKRSGKEVQRTLSQTTAQVMQASEGVNRSTTDRMEAIARLYNDGTKIIEIAKSVGLSVSRVHHYLNKANQAGLIKGRRQRRGSGRTEKQTTPAQTSGSTTSASKADRVLEPQYDDVLCRLGEVETQLAKLSKIQSSSSPAPGIAIIEDLSREFDTIKKEVEIIVGGLAELSKRVQVLEQRRPSGESEMTRELLRLLELALTGERRRIA